MTHPLIHIALIISKSNSVKYMRNYKTIPEKDMKADLNVTSEYDGSTIRAFLAGKLFMSSTMIKKAKLYGTVEVNGEHQIIKYILHTGDQVHIEYNDDALVSPDPDIDIIYNCPDYLVVNKPSGMVTHPTHGHLEDSLITRLHADMPLHPVMRLDRETSGLIVIATNGYAHNTLAKYASIEKRYLAAVYGVMTPSSGRIDLPIARRPDSVMIRQPDPNGRECITDYKTIVTDDINNISLVEFSLLTGRCHQIRVHSLANGHPLVGDGLYGPNSIDNPADDSLKDLWGDTAALDQKVGRVALHAYYLKFTDKLSDPAEERIFVCPLPEDIRSLFSPASLVGIDEFFGKLD